MGPNTYSQGIWKTRENVKIWSWQLNIFQNWVATATRPKFNHEFTSKKITITIHKRKEAMSSDPYFQVRAASFR